MRRQGHAVLLVGINEKDVELREIDRVTAACEIDILDLVADAGRGYNRGIGPYSVVTVTVFDIDIKPVVVIKDAVSPFVVSQYVRWHMIRRRMPVWCCCRTGHTKWCPPRGTGRRRWQAAA